jgi:hypothetical protein
VFLGGLRGARGHGSMVAAKLIAVSSRSVFVRRRCSLDGTGFFLSEFTQTQCIGISMPREPKASIFAEWALASLVLSQGAEHAGEVQLGPALADGIGLQRHDEGVLQTQVDDEGDDHRADQSDGHVLAGVAGLAGQRDGLLEPQEAEDDAGGAHGGEDAAHRGAVQVRGRSTAMCEALDAVPCRLRRDRCRSAMVASGTSINAWDQHLIAEPEGPTFISRTVTQPRFGAPRAAARGWRGGKSLPVLQQRRQPREVHRDAARFIIREHLGLHRLGFVRPAVDV